MISSARGHSNAGSDPVEATTPGTDVEPAPRRWPITLTVLMGTISVVLSTTIINVAIPGIMADFNIDQLHAQWLSTGFLAAMTATMLASARLVERLGQRRTFVAALSVFMATTLLAAAAWDIWVMIAARVVQGATAGVIQPLALVVIFQVFPDHERGRALGLYGMGVVLAPALGPALGGFTLEWLSWRAVYLAPLPFCLLALAGARRTLSGTAGERMIPFDGWGLILLASGLAALLAGLAAAGTGSGWHVGVPIGAGLLALAGFVLREWRAPYPLVAATVFAYPAFAMAAALAAIYGAGLFASMYLLPLLLQGVQGLSAAATGLVVMPAGLALAAIFPLSGRLSDLWPAHWLILGGLTGFAIALFGLAASRPATGFWTLAVWILLGRLGLGFMLPAVNLNALRGVPEALTQQASGVINFARVLGGALGVNLFALLLESRVAGYLAGSGHAGLSLHSFYAASGGAAAAVPAAAREALTHAFAETFIGLGLLFVAALIPAAALGVYRARAQNRSAGV